MRTKLYTSVNLLIAIVTIGAGRREVEARQTESKPKAVTITDCLQNRRNRRIAIAGEDEKKYE